MNILQDKFIKYLLAIVLGLLAIFLFTQALLSYKQYQFVGAGVSASNTISMSGKGEVFAEPNVATFSVTVKEADKKQSEAQSKATKKINKIIKYLKSEGIKDKDIKTTSFNLSPHYDWVDEKRNFRNYEVSQTLKVKIRDTEKSGEILAAMSKFGASYVGSLNFEIDNPDTLKAKAREKAIKDAKAKAEALARQLGVEIIRVVGFTESTNDNFRPVYMAKSIAFDEAMDSDSGPSPELPLGENKITSRVTIKFEIR